MVDRTLARRLFGEGLGTGLLVIAVVGSGIAAERLSPEDVGLQLLENAAATGAALIALILAIGPVSGAHLNPVVTVADRVFGGLTTVEAAGYVAAQTVGAAAGVVIANLMFSLPAVDLSTSSRSSGGLWLAEGVATFGLLLVIFGVVRSGRTSMAPLAVGTYIGGAYFFTSSTSFANPAVTAARMLSDTFAGIDPGSVPPSSPPSWPAPAWLWRPSASSTRVSPRLRTTWSSPIRPPPTVRETPTRPNGRTANASSASASARSPE